MKLNEVYEARNGRVRKNEEKEEEEEVNREWAQRASERNK